MHDNNLDKEPSFNFINYFVPLTTVKIIHFIIIIGLLVFGNGLFNDFVGDDQTQIVGNKTIQNIQNLPAFFTGSTFYNGGGQLSGGNYRPLANVAFSLVYSLFGPNPFGFHLLLVILYITNACLVFFLFKQFFKQSLSFILALIFLVHPINSEVAFYIADMQEALFLFFGITALLIIQNIHLQDHSLWQDYFCYYHYFQKRQVSFLVLLQPSIYFYLKNSVYLPY